MNMILRCVYFQIQISKFVILLLFANQNAWVLNDDLYEKITNRDVIKSWIKSAYAFKDNLTLNKLL